MMKKWIRMISLWMWIPTLLLSQTITLNDAIQNALEKQPGILAEKEENISTKFLKRKALGRFLPQVHMNVRYNHLKNDIVLDLSPIREGILQLHALNAVDLQNLSSLIQNGRPLTPEEQQLVFQTAYQQLNQQFPAFSEKFKNQNYWSGQIQLVQPLWTWGKIWSAYKIADLDRKIATEKLNLKKQKVIAEVVDAYFLNQLLEALVQVKTRTVQSMEMHEHNARRMFEEGLIAKVEYLRASTALEKEKAELEKVKHDLSVARQYLKSRTYLEFNQLADPIHFPKKEIVFDSLLASLERTQPYLNVLELTRKKVGKKIHIDIVENLPTIYAFGQYELFKKDLSVLEPEWVIGIGLKWDLFDGFQHTNQALSDRALRRKVEYAREELRENLQIQLQKLYAEMKNARNNYQALDKALELAKENVKLNRKKFENGLGTSLEVIDAEITLRKVEIGRLKEMYTYNKKLAELLFLTGQADKIHQYF
jgi:outer membrane protein TolC